MPDLKLWRRRLNARKALENAARRRHRAKPTSATRRVLDQRKSQVREARRILTRYASPAKLVAFDGAPIPRGLARMLKDCREHGGWNGRLNSGYRGPGVERFGKKTQGQLWNEYMAGTGAPANRPGQSTHECRSDGSAAMRRLSRAYHKALGRVLRWWQCGMDVTDSDGLLRAMRKLGYSGARTYPDAREYHHLNMKVSPLRRWRERHKAGKV